MTAFNTTTRQSSVLIEVRLQSTEVRPPRRRFSISDGKLNPVEPRLQDEIGREYVVVKCGQMDHRRALFS